ncbi:MAG: beta-ketoacyl synthase N-terminal-like domain-containing protein, partial [Chloroflexi bacterium]|nr:beta-ketoacyl synthase N-terminal-like domain-containing protein [Chloroflexota bacterium]
GADTPEAFWQLLQDGVDRVQEIPRTRWNVDDYYNPRPHTHGKMYTRAAALLDDVAQFDPGFFGISPREATSMDPHHRLLLEVSWETLERAGLAQQTLVDSQTGVFVGIGQSDYALFTGMKDVTDLNVYAATSGGHSVAAGRLAYTLGLQGPTMAVDTACSSSLVALHLACQSLRMGECDLALAGGVNLILSPTAHVELSQMQALSPDGRCKTFAATADGYGRGEGCGMVALKRLSDAEADGDTIIAVIKGSAVNHDGLSSGLTVPNKLAQEKLLRQSLSNAQVTPDEISYIEAHGTGTPLGDPIELRALGAVFGQRENPLLVGSVKTNIGHLEAAAGIAAFIKTVLALQHEQIPAHLHFDTPNPYVAWDEFSMMVPTIQQAWPLAQRIAGVSAFGFSGTNAHVIVAAAPPRIESEVVRCEAPPQQLLTLSAKSAPALAALVTRYLEHLQAHPAIELSELCYGAMVGRNHFDHRLGIVTTSTSDLQTKLAAIQASQDPAGIQRGNLEEQETPPRIAFLFTGQGSQYVDMGRELYEAKTPIGASFRATLDECDALLQVQLGKSLLSILYPASGGASQVEANNIDQTAYTQPALFALEVALATLWQSWGIQPDILIGHSVGELAAACVAGVFSLADGLTLIAARARLMGALPQDGDMVAVTATEAQVQQAIAPYHQAVSIAVINGPTNIVISGKRAAVQAIVAQLTAESINTTPLTVSHAFHSPLMEPILAEFRQVAASITYHKPKLPLISNLTGKLAGDEVTTPDYWVRHIREAVRFADGVATLHEQEIGIFLEIGPKPTLLNLARSIYQNATADETTLVNLKSKIINPIMLPSLRGKQRDWAQLFRTLGELYVQGVAVDWAGVAQSYTGQKALLPTYPFQRKRYWVDPLPPQAEPLQPTPSVRKVELLQPENVLTLKQVSLNAGQAKITLSKVEAPRPVETAYAAAKINLAALAISAPNEPVRLANAGLGRNQEMSMPVVTQATANEQRALKETLKQQLATVLYLDVTEVGDTKKFVDLGLDSVTGVEWVRKINETYALNLAVTDIYDHPTLKALVTYIGATRNASAPNEQGSQQLAQPLSQPEAPLSVTTEATQVDQFALNAILKQQLATVLYLDVTEVGDTKKFVDLGLDSVTGVEWVRKINDTYALNLAVTDIYDHPTLKALVAYIGAASPVAPPPPTVEPLHVDPLPADHKPAAKPAGREEVAIIGIAGRFPGANDVDEFWRNLRDGVSGIREVPAERWAVDDYFDPDPDAKGKTYSKWVGALSQIDHFDPLFFNISPREASLMDPQQRLFLEEAWHALEDAGYAGQDLSASNCGVFVGVGPGDYLSHLQKADMALDAYSMMGTSAAILAARISYFLNLKGPSMAIDTACSASLVAIHEGCQSLLTHQCNMVLAGGVYVSTTPDMHIMTSKADMLAADGQCKTFDNRADGFVLGEGVGVIVLKRLSDALRDRDQIYGVIKGSALNQDGATNGITAPSATAQTELIATIYQKAEIDPRTIQLVEAHGTGTKLGDPVEIKALTAAFQRQTAKTQAPATGYCAIGSVKTNIGHTLAAAGVAGVIKAVLALKHKQLPPTLNFVTPNEHIDFANSPFYVNTTLKAWPAGDTPRMAAVSSFGFSGTNAHLVIAEYAVDARAAEVAPKRPWHLLNLSARSEEALQDLALRYKNYFANQPHLDLADVGYTANVGRTHFPHRLSLTAESMSQMQQKLADYLFQEQPAGVSQGYRSDRQPVPKVAFMFTGEGAQYVGMGRDLYETQPVFRGAMQQCAAILEGKQSASLLDILYGGSKPKTSPLNQTVYTQSALFALEYALAQLWLAWGIEPAAVIGHGVGEVVAACIAGVLSLEDALKLVAARGRLVQALPQPGSMVAVMATEAEVQAALAPYQAQVAIAAVNGPTTVVIAGATAAVQALVAGLEARRIKTRPLTVSHALHSPLLEPMLGEFRQVVATLALHDPQIPIVSNLTGQLVTYEMTSPAYWVQQLRKMVRFADGVTTLHAQGVEIFLEIGPKPTLVTLAQGVAGQGASTTYLSTLQQGRADWPQLLESLGELYTRGLAISWASFDQAYSRHRVVLPIYPFQRKRYWVAHLPQNGAYPAVETQPTPAPVPQVPDKLKLQSGNGDGTAEVQRPTGKVTLSALAGAPLAGNVRPTENGTPMGAIANSAPAPTVVKNVDPVAQRQSIQQTLKQLLSEILYLDLKDIEPDRKFIDLGLDSIT